MKKSKKSKKIQSKIDILSLIISIIFGGLWCIVGAYLYKNVLLHRLPTCIVMGIYFVGLAISACLGMLVSNALLGHTKPKSDDYKMAGITIVVILVAAIVFQLIYGIDINLNKEQEVDAFIFLLDDSGSMGVNDPLDERHKALKTVMDAAEPDKPFVVYSFSEECKKVSALTLAKDVDSLVLDESVPNGKTSMLYSLNKVLSDIENKVIDCGKGSRIILLTDGVSTEIFNSTNFRNMLSNANDLGISISAVGFGECDDNYLQNLADMTDGKYVRAKDASELGQAMLNVSKAVSDYNRDLINHRKPTKSFVEWIYGAERLIFLVLIGVGFIYLKSLLMRTNDSKSNLFLIQIIIVAVGAIGIEIGMNVFYLDEWFMRLVMCLSFTLIYITSGQKKQVAPSYDSSIYDDKKSFKTSSHSNSSSSVSNDDDLYSDLYN